MTLSPSKPQQSALNTTLDQAIAHLQSCSQLDIQSTWHWHQGDLPQDQALDSTQWQHWAIAPLNPRQHIPWPRGKNVLWLAQNICIPPQLNGFALEGLTLRLGLTWWAEVAQIYINGTLTHTGDLFDCFARLLLTPHAKPGTSIEIAIRLVSPGHDDGALVRSRCLYENPNHSLEPIPEPGFVADELAVMQRFLTVLDPDQLPKLTEAIALLNDLPPTDSDAFTKQLNSRLAQLRQQLMPLSDWIKQRTVHLLGHAHLDLAWLWPIAETWDAAQRTFESVLALQKDFPELVFTHSTPALYDWMETHRPDLFQDIQEQVQQGVWEVGAGLWVEPEFNVVSGESIVRQVLYGQHYTQRKFGQISRIAWLPDSFGFCWQLPQILAQGGIDYFATQKLRWNDTTIFPHDLFQWRSPDGTAITSVTLPPIGTDVDPVKIADYASQWEHQTHQIESLWLPGMGDHGGGPTRDMLEVARRWARSPFFPQLSFTAAEPFLDAVCETASTETLPVWDDELYLELHRGCYTTRAEQKYWNRRCEVLLYQAELFAAIATLTTEADFPHAAIEQSWKNVLFNQFHDILPGSSIPEVYEESDPLWQQAETTAEQVLSDALNAIAHAIAVPDPPTPHSIPVILFNSTNWERSEVVTIAVPDDRALWRVHDTDGQEWVGQLTGIDRSGRSPYRHFRFLAPPVPGIGYRLVWLSPGEASTPDRTSELPKPSSQEPVEDTESTWVLENSYLRITVDSTTGDLTEVFDKTAQRHVLSSPGNQLQAFRDQGQYWDAWNIAPDYADHPLPPAKLLDIQWVERGTVQQRLRVIRQIGRSPIQQDYILDAASPLLRIETEVDWHEDFTLLKVAFPVNFEATTATYEIPCGAIARPLVPQTPADQAKWEVPALNWADLTIASETEATSYGVSLLSDCKHGYDATPSCLRLTLLKSPKWPDPDADRGHHHFSYAFYPHQGTWKEANAVRQGYAFAQPLTPIQLMKAQQYSTEGKTLPATQTFINLDDPNLVLMAFKPAEDQFLPESESSHRWMMRCYEACGEGGNIEVEKLCSTSSALSGLNYREQSNILEERSDRSTKSNTSIDESGNELAIAPWKIVTLAFES